MNHDASCPCQTRAAQKRSNAALLRTLRANGTLRSPGEEVGGDRIDGILAQSINAALIERHLRRSR